MNSTAPLVNPNGSLTSEIVSQLFRARKTKPVWAKLVESPTEIRSLEGLQQVPAGSYLCRGIRGEYWPQSEKKLLETYNSSGEFDDQGFQRFDAKPDAPVVEAAQVDHAFRVVAHWGELNGKPNDYVVRSTTNPSDVWIVAQAIFDASYDRVKE